VTLTPHAAPAETFSIVAWNGSVELGL
jgi:hypothetical protein